MRDPDLCLHDGECYEEAVYCQKHYNALAARLAEAERLLRRVPYITPVKKLHQDIGEFLRTADSADAYVGKPQPLGDVLQRVNDIYEAAGSAAADQPSTVTGVRDE
jgi:hypothetical protein